MADAILSGISSASQSQADELPFVRFRVRGQSVGNHSGVQAFSQRKGLSNGRS